MIRQAYWEHPHYVPLLLRAYELWKRLELDSGADLLHITGGLVIGSQTGDLVRRSRASCEAHGLPYQMLSAAELRRRFPVFRVGDHQHALFEAQAGYLRAEECVRQQIALSARAGAALHFGEQVLAWEVRPGSVRVTTTRATYEAERLVITAGPWTAQTLRELALPLTVTRQILFWFAPSSNASQFQEKRLPVYLFEAPDGEPMLYGFPETADESGLVKVALHGSSDLCTPESVERTVGQQEIDAMRARLRTTLPLLSERCVRTETCLYTMTPDEHFIIDRLPTAPQVTFACGFSGHGFKFANLVGEILADLSCAGTTPHPIDLFSLRRFAQQEATAPSHA